jgi:hypothetical protein
MASRRKSDCKRSSLSRVCSFSSADDVGADCSDATSLSTSGKREVRTDASSELMLDTVDCCSLGIGSCTAERDLLVEPITWMVVVGRI